MSIRERALAGVRTPHAAILEILERGPSTTHEIARRLDMRPGSLMQAIRSLHRQGELYVCGTIVARATFYERLSDGLRLAAIDCNGGPTAAAQGAPPGDAA